MNYRNQNFENIAEMTKGTDALGTVTYTVTTIDGTEYKCYKTNGLNGRTYWNILNVTSKVKMQSKVYTLLECLTYINSR